MQVSKIFGVFGSVPGECNSLRLTGVKSTMALTGSFSSFSFKQNYVSVDIEKNVTL